MATYQTLIDLALQQALTGVDQLRSALLDADMTMESLVGQVFQQVAIACASDPDKLSLLRRTHTVTLANGVGVLPDLVLTQEVFGSTVDVPAESDIGPLMTFTPWVSFVSPSDTRLGYYSIRGDTEFYWVDPGDAYPPLTGRTGDIEYTGASVPAVPATATDQVVVPAEIFSDLVTALSIAIRTVVISAKRAA